MKRLMLLLALIPLVALLLPAFASADLNAWLKDDNPNEMYTMSNSDSDCPISKSELKETVNGVLIRSRIRPLSLWNADTVVLRVSLKCMGDSEVQTYSLSVQLLKLGSNPGNDLLLTTMPANSDYGFFGRGTKSSMSDAVKDAVEDALTDYMKANFDLGEVE